MDAETVLKSCPFCGGEAERFTIGEDEPTNVGGDVISCKRCGASSHVEFGRKENLVDRWNTRPTVDAPAKDAEIAALRERVAELEAGLRFYANSEIYEPHPHGPAFDRRDLSYHARALLEPEAGK